MFLYSKYREGENDRARERESARDCTETETENLRGREGWRERERERERESKVICLNYEHIIAIERKQTEACLDRCQGFQMNVDVTSVYIVESER